MFNQTFDQFSNTFHVIAVQVANIWTNPASAREIDRTAISNPTDITSWIESQTDDQKLSLCDDNRVQTQGLFGEAVIIQEIKGDWAKVTLPSQPTRKDEKGYPGWVPLAQLAEVKKGDWLRQEMAAIKSKHAWLEKASGEKVMKLSYMTCLPLKNVVGERVEVITPQGIGFLPLDTVELFPTEKGGEKGDGPAIIAVGEKYIGLDYLWGGMSAFGYDCSGLAYAMHKANGYRISRDASEQAEHGIEIPFDELMPGDLLFFAYQEGNNKGKIHHVGFYHGEGKMLHSPQTGKTVEITNLKGTKYEKELCIARRYWVSGGVS